MEQLEQEAARFRAAATTDRTAAVPGCPGWDVDELVRHLGTAYANVAAIVGERMTSHPKLADIEPPAGADSLAWFDEQLPAVLDVLRRTDPTTPVWTFGADRTAGFWRRRMVQETLVHRVDAEQAAGLPVEVDAALALDGIAEAFEVFVPLLQSRMTGPGATMHLHATDAEGEWLLQLDEGAVEVTTGHAKGDAAVRGPAGQLLLWLWGRAAEVELFGDPAVADRYALLRA